MRRVDGRARSERAATLAARLGQAAAALIAVIADVEPDRWRYVPAPGAWAIGKDAEHVIEAAGYHQWIVRRTIGQKVSSRRPVLERTQLTTNLSPQEALEQLRRRTDEGAGLILGLTDEQLDLPTRPPRARSQRLAETIELVLIGHYDGHRGDIEAKSRLR
jgi:DinB superfamily